MIANSLTVMRDSLVDIYDALEEKGAILPAEKNLVNVEPALETIPIASKKKIILVPLMVQNITGGIDALGESLGGTLTRVGYGYLSIVESALTNVSLIGNNYNTYTGDIITFYVSGGENVPIAISPHSTHPKMTIPAGSWFIAVESTYQSNNNRSYYPSGIVAGSVSTYMAYEFTPAS